MKRRVLHSLFWGLSGFTGLTSMALAAPGAATEVAAAAAPRIEPSAAPTPTASARTAIPGPTTPAGALGTTAPQGTVASADPASAPGVASVAGTASPGVATPPPAVSPLEPTWSTCRENVPSGKTRPEITEQFPSQVIAGHAAVLEVTLTHGKGERVLADAFELQRDSDGAKALRQSGFEFPATTGPGAPRVERTERESDAVTVVKLAVVALPKEPGPHPFTLPPLPIAVARASGEVLTLCTTPHAVTVTDPTANVPHAVPKRHPGGERQRELWVGMRNVTYGALIGLAIAGVIALVPRWFSRRPKVLPPPPPPRPAWEVALEALSDLRYSDLLQRGQFTSHLERVNHVLRQYLGGRFGFDGLESTTEEVLVALRSSSLQAELRGQTERMLRDSDLVKFAKLVPTEAQCTSALDEVEGLVRKTMHREPEVLLGDDKPTAPVSLGANIRHPGGAVTIAEAPNRQSLEQARPTDQAPPTDAAPPKDADSSREGSS